MKKLIVLIVVSTIFIAGCKHDTDNDVKKEDKTQDEKYYYNRKGVIVRVNDEEAKSKDKFHRPVLCANVLIQDIIDTTLFFELSTCNYNDIITKEWYYNHYEGDTVHFDYISKNRYFKIKPRKPSVK